jgi:1-deoxy-D-xylulose-5-phosphate reductoisomerase
MPMPLKMWIASACRPGRSCFRGGKTVAVANKETLVMAGPLVMALARERGGRVLPVDSEHSAIFQALECGRRSEVARVVLTASGGPFRGFAVAGPRNWQT